MELFNDGEKRCRHVPTRAQRRRYPMCRGADSFELQSVGGLTAIQVERARAA